MSIDIEIAQLEHDLETLREEGRRSPERFAYLQPARDRLQRRLRCLRMEQRADMVAIAEQQARVSLAEWWSACWPASVLVVIVFGGIGVLLAIRG